MYKKQQTFQEKSAEQDVDQQAIQGTSVPHFCFQENCFNLEIANTPEEKVLGLMFREHLDENRGMIFPFEEETFHSFWMKNTLISLDIIWYDSWHQVVDIISAPPCEEEPCPSYVSETPAIWVIEVNSWVAEKIGLEKGSIISLHDI